MTVQQAADYLHCHYGTVWRLIRERELGAFRVGGAYRLRRIDIDHWIEQQGAESGKTAPTKGARGRR